VGIHAPQALSVPVSVDARLKATAVRFRELSCTDWVKSLPKVVITGLDRGSTPSPAPIGVSAGNVDGRIKSGHDDLKLFEDDERFL
jgi:hypothetical protein